MLGDLHSELRTDTSPLGPFRVDLIFFVRVETFLGILRRALPPMGNVRVWVEFVFSYPDHIE